MFTGTPKFHYRRYSRQKRLSSVICQAPSRSNPRPYHAVLCRSMHSPTQRWPAVASPATEPASRPAPAAEKRWLIPVDGPLDRHTPRKRPNLLGDERRRLRGDPTTPPRLGRDAGGGYPRARGGTEILPQTLWP